MQQSELGIEYGDDNSDEEFDSPELILTHRPTDFDVRRRLIEFRRYFLSGSIPGGVLRTTEATTQARKISAELSNFATCLHNGARFCNGCRKNLFIAGKEAQMNLSAACRVACAIASSQTESHSSFVRKMSLVVSEVISKAVNVRERYLNLFNANQEDNMSMYNSLHVNGNALGDVGDDDWLSEAQRTGEFFPGITQIRPVTTFGDSSKKENSRSCRKNHVKSDSHRPGIFTVQCVCRYTKLIGLSVMQECEGVSTALSVLFL